MLKKGHMSQAFQFQKVPSFNAPAELKHSGKHEAFLNPFARQKQPENLHFVDLFSRYVRTEIWIH